MARINWDVNTWPVSELLSWQYAIAERSDRVISEAMLTDDWSNYEADERMYNKLSDALTIRGLNAWGSPSNDIEVQHEKY